MWRLIVGTLLLVLRFTKANTLPCPKDVDELDLPRVGNHKISSNRIVFVEERVKENFAFVMESYDLAKREGQNVLQWLFGAIVGGLGLVGSLAKADFWVLAFGVFIAVAWAAWNAALLIEALRSNEIQAPGNSVNAFREMMEEGISETRMRWREAMGISERAEKNGLIIEKIALGTDRARTSLAYIPAWFLGASTLAWLIQIAYREKLFKFLLDFLEW